ncbi:MAG: hypothetical protein ACJ77D_09195 [Chloroflexota bacterium]
MRSSFPRLFAAFLLSVTAVLTGLTGLGLAAANAVIATGRFVVRPADAAALDQLTTAAPALAAFALASLAAAIALVLMTSWSRRLAIGVTATGVAFGIVALVMVMLAQGPFAVIPSTRALDGIEAIGTFTVIQLVALVASIVDRSSIRAIAAGPAAAG